MFIIDEQKELFNFQ